MAKQKVRTRFAPSPTGFLHVGGARTALFNYLFARRHQGQFILRIEDTDTERNRPEFEQEILFSMKWLGLDWDEGPVYQSKRFDLYRDFVKKLLDAGKAYRCYCTAAEVEAMRAEAQARGAKPQYNRKCRDRTDHPDLPFCVRFKTPLDGHLTLEDEIKGKVVMSMGEIDDFVLLRTNDTPIYNLTVVVDDVAMEISHVIRGEEHLANTWKQILIMDALGGQRPVYAHLPLILATDRSKLSKRHGAVGVSEFMRQGYLPWALGNYLAKLGFSEGDREIYSKLELVDAFSLDRVSASGAVFDLKKLDWFNAHYIKASLMDDLLESVSACTGADVGYFRSMKGKRLFQALQERATRLSDFVDQSLWFKSDSFARDEDSVKTILDARHPKVMGSLVQKFSEMGEEGFVADQAAGVFKQVAADLGIKMPDVAKPARLALTGTLKSPDIGLVVEVLGRDRVLSRLKPFV